jgi:hypothetical protein
MPLGWAWLFPSLIALGLLSVVFASLVARAIWWRRVHRRLLWIVGLLCVATSVLLGDVTSRPLSDAPALEGQMCVGVPARPADHSFSVLGARLETYDVRGDEPGPIILRRRRDGRVDWCRVASEVDDSPVKTVRFDGWSPSPFGPVVHGYSGRAVTVMLWWTGGLRAYFYSW